MTVGEQVGSFLMTGFATVGVVTASRIAFVLTCLPSSIATNNIGVGADVRRGGSTRVRGS